MSQDQHVAKRFRAIAHHSAGRIALSFWAAGRWQSWTYAELAERAQAIATRLQQVGVRPGVAVGVAAQRLPGTIAALLAVLDIGAFFVPLDPSLPPARAQLLGNKAGVAWLVDASDDSGGSGAVSIRAFDLTGAGPAAPAAEYAHLVGSPEAVAYVMFTSGSTGQPKGVVVPHRAITRLVTDQDYVKFGADRVFLQAAPMSFDASTLEIWGPLLHGGRCVLYPAGSLPTADGLRDVIAATGVTTAWLTASLFHALVDLDVQSLAGLQELLVGGEALSVPHVRKALAALPHTRLVNGYGPTENTTFSACYRIPGDLPSWAPRVPIGLAIRGTQLAVVDEALRPVAPGVEGELVAMGDGLALGYLGEPELTKKQFVDLKFVEPGGADGVVRRGYCTGDRVVEGPDGVFEFLGRRDAQVKIHGYRIEPGEVEGVVAGLPGVLQCRVLAQADPAGQLRLVAYVVLAPGAAVGSLQQAMVATLPVFMVPHQVVVLPKVPLNANGKLATELLPSPWATPAATPPARRSNQFAWVEQAWHEVLGRAPDSADVNFFDAGGRSLDAVRLHNLIEQRTGLTLEPTFVFEFATPNRQTRALAARLGSSTTTSRRSPPSAVPNPIHPDHHGA